MINKVKSNIFQLYFQEFGSCVYFLKIKDKKILIDTSSQEARKELLEDLKKLKINPEEIDIVILTHSHWDHKGNIELFSDSEIYDNKNKKEIEKIGFNVIEVPGHTKDSIALLYDDILFSGDTLFYKGIGRTDFPESSPKEMLESLEKLRKLKDIKWKILCPGHI